MIGQSTSKCYTEEVKGKVTAVEIGYSSSGVQELAFSTYTNQVSITTASQTSKFELDSGTYLVGLHGTASDQIGSLGIVTLNF